MIEIQAWQVDFHPGKLDLGLLMWTDKLKGILKLYTAVCSSGYCEHCDLHLSTGNGLDLGQMTLYVYL